MIGGREEDFFWGKGDIRVYMNTFTHQDFFFFLIHVSLRIISCSFRGLLLA